MKRIKSFFRINPIIVKELRSRMRGPRAFLTLTISLIVTGGILYGLLQVMIAMSQYSSDILSPRIGQSLFMALAFIELMVVCAVTPAVTAGAISGEREKQTYDMLAATPLSPARLLWGKLIAALGYIFILLFAAVPLSALVFIFGGVALRDMLKALVVLLVLTGSLGVLGLFMSALFKRTGRATVASFIVVALLVFVPLFVTIAMTIVRQSDANLPRWLMAFSPVSMLMSTMDISGNYGSLIYQLIPFFGGYWMSSAMSPVSMTGIPRPLYHYGIPFYLGLALVLYLLASRLVQPFNRWRMKPREWITGIALVLAFAAATGGLYVLTADRYEWVKAPVVQTNMPVTEPAMPVPAVVVATSIVEIPANPGDPTPDGTITVTPTPIQDGGGVGFITPTPTPFAQGEGPTPTPAQQGDGVNIIPVTPEAPVGQFFDQPDTAGEIYAAVARYVLTNDPKLMPPSVIYIIDKSDDGAGDPSALANSSPFSEELKAAISKRLSDLNVRVEFAASRDDLIVNFKTHEVKDGGAVITLGNIRAAENGVLKVPGSIYWSGKAARGDVYLLSQEKGLWVVTGGTAEWVS